MQLQKHKTLPKIIAVIGPTASGKTEMSIALAKKYKGEVIAADSRTVYKEMDIGTAKPTGKWKKLNSDQVLMIHGIAHHLFDLVKPDEIFTVAEFKKLALEKITEIIKRNHLPFLVGGTGLYIASITENLEIPKVMPDWQLRKKLDKEIKGKGLEKIVKKLLKLDPEASAFVDLKNPRRVIRALEIIIKTKKPLSCQRMKGPKIFETLKIGLKISREALQERIKKRVKLMLKGGFVKEVQKLKRKYGCSVPAMSGIGYRAFCRYLNGEISKKEAEAEFVKGDLALAKRQMTWFRKDREIKWVRHFKETESLIKNF